MATIFEDNFNSYNDGDLNGQGGWSGNASFKIQGEVVKEGAKAVKNDTPTTGGFYISKVGTLIGDGKINIYVRKNDVSTDIDAELALFEGTGQKIWFDFKGPYFRYWSGSSYIIIKSDGQANRWYNLQVEWRSSDKKVRYSIDGVPLTSWVNPGVSWANGFDKVQLGALWISLGLAVYFDYIAENPYIPPKGRSIGYVF
jgi:hypothetical protein